MILKDGKFWDDEGNVVPIEHGNKEQIALMIEAMQPKPEKLKVVNLSKVEDTLKEYIKDIGSCDFNSDRDSDWEHAIYEKTMEAFYGEKFWDYINDKLK
jgi:hypothetical protein